MFPTTFVAAVPIAYRIKWFSLRHVNEIICWVVKARVLMQQLTTWSVAMMHTIMQSVCVVVDGDLNVTFWVVSVVGDG
jgi:hypothetical protein